jgi:antitoxin VapB
MYMALHIQDPETDKLARELSAATGETITQAVNIALRDRISKVVPAPTEEEYIARITAITDRLAKLPVLDNRTADEIIGYNEHGLFD